MSDEKLKDTDEELDEIMDHVRGMSRDDTADFFAHNIEMFTMLLRGTVGFMPTANYLRKISKKKHCIVPDHLHQEGM